MTDLTGKRILVIGMGRSGKAAVEAGLAGNAIVSVQDSKKPEEIDENLLAYLKARNIEMFLGTKPEDMGAFDMLVLSPGVPPTLDFIEEARAKGAQIIGELELAYRVGHGRYVAITGTNGKTTTTTLVGEIYRAAGLDTYVVGNIGYPVVTESMNAGHDSWLITEVSSFQLETVSQFRPVVSAILNLTEDHMDRHKTMENYGIAKAQIFAQQTEDEFCVLNYDDKLCFDLAQQNGCRATVVPFSRIEELQFGAFVKDGNIVIRDDGRGQSEGPAEIIICAADELKIPGSHNLENALAATAIAYFGGIDVQVITDTLKSFAGVEHRIELCGEINGVRFVNDSKGTNPDAAIKAIEAMKENIILIAGGYDKNSEYDQFVATFPGRVKALMLMGVTAPKIKETAEKAGFTNIYMEEDMEGCVKHGFELAEPGDVILLSPACASWDMYPNFERRGEHFKECMEALK